MPGQQDNESNWEVHATFKGHRELLESRFSPLLDITFTSFHGSESLLVSAPLGQKMYAYSIFDFSSLVNLHSLDMNGYYIFSISIHFDPFCDRDIKVYSGLHWSQAQEKELQRWKAELKKLEGSWVGAVLKRCPDVWTVHREPARPCATPWARRDETWWDVSRICCSEMSSEFHTEGIFPPDPNVGLPHCMFSRIQGLPCLPYLLYQQFPKASDS